MSEGKELIGQLIGTKLDSLLMEQLTKQQKLIAKRQFRKFLQNSLDSEAVIKALKLLSGLDEEEIISIYRTNLELLTKLKL